MKRLSLDADLLKKENLITNSPESQFPEMTLKLPHQLCSICMTSTHATTTMTTRA